MNGIRFFDNDDADLFLDRGLALPSRTIYIGSEWGFKDEAEETGVDFRLADKVIKSLHILNSMDEAAPINIIINNPGGDEYHGLAIYDAIHASVAPVKAVVYGAAMSMASIILQAASERVMTPNATMMVHMGQLATIMDQRDIEAYTKEWTRINHIVNEIYLGRLREKNPRYSANQLKDLLSTERYMGAREVIELGLADKILGQ